MVERGGCGGSEGYGEDALMMIDRLETNTPAKGSFQSIMLMILNNCIKYFSLQINLQTFKRTIAVC